MYGIKKIQLYLMYFYQYWILWLLWRLFINRNRNEVNRKWDQYSIEYNGKNENENGNQYSLNIFIDSCVVCIIILIFTCTLCIIGMHVCHYIINHYEYFFIIYNLLFVAFLFWRSVRISRKEPVHFFDFLETCFDAIS